MKNFFLRFILPFLPLLLLIFLGLRDSRFSSICFFGVGMIAQAYLLIREKIKSGNTSKILWIIFGAGILTLFFGLSPEVPIEPLYLFSLFYIFFICCFFVIYHRVILLPLDEKFLAVWNLFFWYLYLKNSVSFNFLTYFFLALTAISFIIIFSKRVPGLFWKTLLYCWFLIMMVSTAFIQNKTAALLPFYSESSVQDYPGVFLAGMFFFYICIYSAYILVLLAPLIIGVKISEPNAKNANIITIKDQFRQIKNFSIMMTADFSEAQSSPAKIIATILLFGGGLAINYFFKLIPDIILVNVLIIVFQFWRKEETIKDRILNSIKPVVEKSKFVSINKENLNKLVEKLKNVPLKNWDNEMQLLGTLEQTLLYYFFLDSINFCFWQEKGKEKWKIEKDGKWIDGYYAFSYAIKKSFLENKKLQSVESIVKISFEDFKRIFQGDFSQTMAQGELLLMEYRYKIVKQNFRILQDKYWGSVKNLVLEANGNVNKLVRLLITDFPSFRDVSEFQNQKVYFLKRAQLFPSDLYHAFLGKNFGEFKNIEDLTIFVDYKIPQLLESEGVLVYSEKLKNLIQNEELIKKDSIEEIEIRANTIYACELIVKKLAEIGRNLSPNDLDWLLWSLSKEYKPKMLYHKTITINY